MLYRAVFAFALAVPALASPAVAETAEERLACTADAQTLCTDEIPEGREKVYLCLVKRVNDLSPACRRIISASIASPPGATATGPSKRKPQ